MRRAGIGLLYLAALAGGTYVAFRPTLDSGFARVQADPGDTLFNHYVLEHTWQVVSDPGYRGTLLSPPFFYPTRLVLGYSENLLGVAPAYWLLRLVLPYILAYQVWMILMNALNFVAFAAVARWFRCGHLLAAFGGFLWAFALVHVEQVRHQQMIARFWMPIAAYHAWHLAAGPNLRSLNRTAACVFLQTLTCINSGWFLAVGLATFVPLAAASARPDGLRELGQFCRENRRAIARVVGLWALALLAFFVPYFVANRGVVRGYEECVDLIPTAAGWLAGQPGSRWYETIRPYRRGLGDEGYLFCGFALYMLILAAAIHAWVHRRDPDRPWELAFAGAALLTAGIWVVLTLNVYGGASGWYVVRFVPGGQAVRCVTRVYVLVYLFADLAVILWLKLVLDRTRRWVQVVVVLAAVAAVFEQTGFEPGSFATADVYPLCDKLAEGLRGADAGYVLPRPRPFRLHGDLLGMWAGLRANVPVVNGYSGRYPDNYPFDDLARADEELRVWLGGRFRGRVAVIDPVRPDEVRYVRIE
jgi:hypothetical protein